MRDFESWYVREHPKVLAVCQALAGDVDAALEATDEAFARALERWSQVSGMSAPGGWVQVVALNQLRRGLRRRRLEATLLRSRWPDPPAAIPDVELWMLVARLPARQQLAVVLRHVHGLPEAHIAETMGVTRGTVATTLSVARRRLRQDLSAPVSPQEVLHG